MKIELKIPNKEPRKFSFRFDFNAMAEYEEMFDRSPTDIKGLGLSTARNIAYIGFREADPTFDLTLQETGQAMNAKTMNEIFEEFGKNMSTINGVDEEVKK